MSTYTTLPSKGFGMGKIVIVTAQDATDGEVIVDFTVDLPIVTSITIYDATGVAVPFASNADTTDTVTITPKADGVVTYPALGQVRIANGTNFALVAGHRIDIVAQFAKDSL